MTENYQLKTYWLFSGYNWESQLKTDLAFSGDDRKYQLTAENGLAFSGYNWEPQLKMDWPKSTLTVLRASSSEKEREWKRKARDQREWRGSLWLPSLSNTYVCIHVHRSHPHHIHICHIKAVHTTIIILYGHQRRVQRWLSLRQTSYSIVYNYVHRLYSRSWELYSWEKHGWISGSLSCRASIQCT